MTHSPSPGHHQPADLARAAPHVQLAEVGRRVAAEPGPSPSVVVADPGRVMLAAKGYDPACRLQLVIVGSLADHLG
jgi:hypothetical protein